jgi:ComF family protein
MLEPGMQLCWDCRSALSVITPPQCLVCGEPVFGRVDHDYTCHVCCRSKPLFHRARAAIHYNVVGKGLITQFKYNNALWLESFLVELLSSCVAIHYDQQTFDAVSAVPLHPVKRRERGYNQSALLAAGLARRLGKPVLGARSLRRIRRTPSQTHLTAKERRTNVWGAFEAGRGNDWKGKRVLLVDDVMTTGATVNACARAILDAGAASVEVVTVARGI